jgi:branched-chain amino acid transport system ATP-binding protein
MDISVAFSLLQEGLTNGAVYSLIALSLVLVFAVTRVIMVQSGEFVSYGALTIYALQGGKTPMTLWIMLMASACAGFVELNRLRRVRSAASNFVRPVLVWFVMPAVVVAAALWAPRAGMAMVWQVVLTLAIVVPLGASMYRLVYQPIAHASILVLLIVSVATHFVMDGLALVAFGPDGARTASFSDARFDVAGESVAVQSMVVLAVSVILVVILFWFFRHTMYGRALRATASNRRGAALMGISSDMAGITSFTLTTFICTTAGILIGPFVTIYYNSGFLISLKAFVGATVGAMVSFPLAAVGALSIGIFESFAAFWSSSYKESLVFALMVPILLGCSLLARHTVDDEEEKAGAAPGSAFPALRRIQGAFQNVAQRVPRGMGTLVLLLGLVALPFVFSRFYVTLVSYACLYAIVCYGVILLTGVAGQVSFGQAAFVGIGAYASGVLTTSCAIGGALRNLLGDGSAQALSMGSCGLSPWLSLPVALAATALSAWLLGSVTLRMRGHYLPIATIAWSVSIFYVFANTDSIGASTGMTDLPAIPLPLSGGARSDYEFRVYFLVVAVMLFLGWTTRNLLDSRTGRAIRALKSKSLMAESMGVDVGLLKTKVFVCAAVYAGISGWLYAHMQRFINPASFGLDMSVQYVFMSVVGGVEQVAGAMLGSTVVRVVDDWLQNVLRFGIFEKAGNVEKVFFGVLIIVLLQRTQNGLAYLVSAFSRRSPVAAKLPQLIVREPHAPARQDASLLKLTKVSKQFGGLKAVSDVDFEVFAGEIVAVIGPNGAGKSTIFNLISGALKVSDGTILFGGTRIDRMPSHAIARIGLSRTFQHVKLLNDLSVLENVALGAYRLGGVGMLATLMRLDRSEESRALDDAAATLERVGLRDVAHLNAGSLPLGKQRILEIARALASEPRMLLLDEPAAGLRSGEKRELALLLRGLRAEGVAILLVEHDMAFVMELADRVIVQNFGRTLATGAPSEVQSHPDVIAAYLGAAA